MNENEHHIIEAWDILFNCYTRLCRTHDTKCAEGNIAYRQSLIEQDK